MLKEYFHPVIGRKRIQNKIIFQQDGAAPHFRIEVREWLNSTFPGRWIGRRGPMEWAPRSPDLTPLDFYLWDYLNQKAFSKPLNDLQELRERITQEISLIKPETLEKVFTNVVKR